MMLIQKAASLPSYSEVQRSFEAIIRALVFIGLLKSTNIFLN